jgi:replicative DNA helicase
MIRDLAKEAAFSERCVLGCLWYDPQLWVYASELLPADFLLEDHQTLWSAILHVQARGQFPDVANITLQLERMFPEGTVHAARLTAYYQDCEVGVCVCVVGIKDHVRQVKALSQTRRRARELASEYAELTGDPKWLAADFEVRV